MALTHVKEEVLNRFANDLANALIKKLEEEEAKDKRKLYRLQTQVTIQKCRKEILKDRNDLYRMGHTDLADMYNEVNKYLEKMCEYIETQMPPDEMGDA